MNILIVTSHTGGHFYPAIEICKKFLTKSKKIIFVTQKGKLFVNLISDHIKSEKVFIEFITAPQLPRKNLLKLSTTLFLFITSLLKSIIILLKHRPKLIFSAGGYTAVPVVIAAKFFSPQIPVVLYEQNCVLSLTNKLLKLFATKICIGFNLYQGTKYVFTGNPLREEFNKVYPKEQIMSQLGFDNKKFTLFVFGGSQGAKSINTAIIDFLRSNQNLTDKLQIIHITGQQDYIRVVKEYTNLKFNYKILPFTEEIYKFYTVAELVVCRAGAMTITELIHFKKPAILIPLPTAAELHQNWNAYYLTAHGCAKVVYQSKNWEIKLHKLLIEFITNPEILRSMSENYAKILQPKISIETVIENIYKSKYGRIH